MLLSRDCIGGMITDDRTCAGKLIVRDLEKAYAGRLIARRKPMNFLHLPPILGATNKCRPYVK